MNLLTSITLTSSWGRKVAKNFSIGMAGSVCTLVFSLGRTAVLTKHLSVADYGRLFIVINLFSLVMMLAGIRVADMLFRFYPQFKEKNDIDALRSLLFLCLFICFVLGLSVSVGLGGASVQIATSFYDDQQLPALIIIYAIGFFFSAFDGFSLAILRYTDKFHLLVIPQIAESFLVFSCCWLYFLTTSEYSLSSVICFLSLGIAVRTMPPLAFTLHYLHPLLFAGKKPNLTALAPYRRQLIDTFFQTNLVRYLKLGSLDGGIFLLGILAGPLQVAYFSFARQVLRPLELIQNNVQAAVYPEIVSLNAAGKFKDLHRLVKYCTIIPLGPGVLVFLLAAYLAEPVMLLLSSQEYSAALPIVYTLLFANYLTCGSVAYYPLALCMDKLKQRNKVVSISFVYLAVASFTGLSAFTVAVVLAASAVTVRLLNDVPLYFSLLRLCKD